MALFTCCCISSPPCAISVYGRQAQVAFTGFHEVYDPATSSPILAHSGVVLYDTVNVKLLDFATETELWSITEKWFNPQNIRRVIDQSGLPGYTPGELPPSGSPVVRCSPYKSYSGGTWNGDVFHGDGFGGGTNPYKLRTTFSGLIDFGDHDALLDALIPSESEMLEHCDSLRNDWAGYDGDGAIRIDTFDWSLFGPPFSPASFAGVAPPPDAVMTAYDITYFSCPLGNSCPMPQWVTRYRKAFASCALISGGPGAACERICDLQEFSGPCSAWAGIGIFGGGFTALAPDPPGNQVDGPRLYMPIGNTYQYVHCGTCL